MAAYVLFDLVYRVARELGVAFEGTATGGAAGQLTDNIFLKNRFGDDYFNAGTLLLLYDAGGLGASPQGEWARITDYAQNPGVIFHENFLAPEGVGDRYAAIGAEFTLDTLIQNINMALNSIQIPYIDITTITTEEDKTEYTLPTDLLDQDINVYIQRASTTDNYLWLQVYDWYIAETAVGTAKELIFRTQPPAPYIVKLEYWKQHPSLNVRTDKLAEAVNIDRVSVESALRCLMWKKAQKSQADPILDMRLGEMSSRVAAMRAKYPIRKRGPKLATLGRIDNFG